MFILSTPSVCTEHTEILWIFVNIYQIGMCNYFVFMSQSLSAESKCFVLFCFCNDTLELQQILWIKFHQFLWEKRDYFFWKKKKKGHSILQSLPLCCRIPKVFKFSIIMLGSYLIRKNMFLKYWSNDLGEFTFRELTVHQNNRVVLLRLEIFF